VTLLEEDFALLLDFAELLEAMLLLDFAELLLDIDEDDLAELLLDLAELLDFGVTLEEDDFALTLEEDFTLDEEFDFTELLLASSQSSQTLDEESSPGRTKLLSSSQAAKRKRLAIKNVTPM